MKLSEAESKIHKKLYSKLNEAIEEFRPAQSKSIEAGLLDDKNVLVCTPTASGKTLISELAMLNNIYSGIGKAIYIVPLKALATEKYKHFSQRYKDIKVGISIGDTDSPGAYLANYDLIITTSEKLDSLIRHHSPWIRDVKTVVVDEIHLLNDQGRGPTLEILITILKTMLKGMQFIGLSATIGNPKELAEWLEAELVEDDWRPVELKKGVMEDFVVDYY